MNYMRQLEAEGKEEAFEKEMQQYKFLETAVAELFPMK